MDLYCQRCDEPWDLWHVNNEMDQEPDDYAPDGTRPSARFRKGEGCPACDWGKKAPKQQSLKGMAMGALYDVLGDDEDGIAAMMDDFDFAGMLDEEDFDE